MSDLISATAIQDSLTECKVCEEQFNESDRIPRRMGCCVHSICQPCLNRLYNIESQSLRCPLCRQKHDLPGGVTSLPKEAVILKILEHLKIQKRIRLSCTGCPDSHPAESQCENCGIFLCSRCHNAHARNVVTKDHTIVSLEDMKNRPMKSFCRQHRCMEHQQILQFYCKTCDKVICGFCTVVDHKPGNYHNIMKIDEAHVKKDKVIRKTLSRLGDKENELKDSLLKLERKTKNFKVSVQRANDETNRTFDKLIEALQKRKTSVLLNIQERSNEELKYLQETKETTETLLAKVKSSSEYTRQIRAKADKIEDLGLIPSVVASLSMLLDENIEDGEFTKRGITFVLENVTILKYYINKAGHIRTVTFAPTERPSFVPETERYNAITIEPAALAHGWDPNTASDDVTIVGSVVTNTRPVPPPPVTGCRIESSRKVLASRPIEVKRGQRVTYRVKIRCYLKQILDPKENDMLFDLVLTKSPVDSNWSLPTGLSVCVQPCKTHKRRLCLSVLYNNKRLTDEPFTRNMVGVSLELNLCLLLDGETKTIHVVDADKVKIVHSVPNVVFDKALWVMMFVNDHDHSNLSAELIPDYKATVPQNLKQFISSLH